MSTCWGESDSWTSGEEEESDTEADCGPEDGGGWDNDFYSYASFQDEESESDYCDTDEEQQQEELSKSSVPPGDAHRRDKAMMFDSQNHKTSAAAPKAEQQGSDDEDMASDEQYGGRIVESEKCLISVTKLYRVCKSSTFQKYQSQGTQTGFDLPLFDDFSCESEVPDTAWYALTDLIFNRDGHGIINWFKKRKVSASTKMAIGSEVDSPLKIAIRAGSVVIFNYLCGQGFPFHPSCHPFFEATKEGSLPHLKRMLDLGVDINISDDENMTALHLASREPYDYSPIIKFLVAHGADVGQVDEFGATPIFRAVMSGSEENINCLIEADSPLNKQNFEGRPILHAAVLRGFKMVKRLYRAGARPGTSPIYDEVRAAVRGGHINILRYLIRKNAPLRTKSFKKNLTTLCHAITCPDVDVGTQMLDMLLAAGYDISAEPNIEKHVPPQYFRGPRGKALKKKLVSFNTNLKSLKELSCLKARQALGTSLPDMLKDGSVPPAIRNQLSLKHV
ncbi:ankyrin-3-like [Haliotis rufescens]|uniref:ankyrin-3-like n=1 Tax=Haliotis rufescens TaxID=6454 RepID=UPI00201E7DB1|nr:ankyrin-3-like [Haliotis rufescens]XP_046363170.2 ankyrin-3-like [Haliotis rufescens]